MMGRTHAPVFAQGICTGFARDMHIHPHLAFLPLSISDIKQFSSAAREGRRVGGCLGGREGWGA